MYLQYRSATQGLIGQLLFLRFQVNGINFAFQLETAYFPYFGVLSLVLKFAECYFAFRVRTFSAPFTVFINFSMLLLLFFYCKVIIILIKSDLGTKKQQPRQE